MVVAELRPSALRAARRLMSRVESLWCSPQAGQNLKRPGINQARRPPGASRTIRQNSDEFGFGLTIGRLQPKFARTPFFEPRVRIILIPSLKEEFAIDRLRHEKAPAASGSVGIVILVDRHVVDLSLFKARRPHFFERANGVMLLAAPSAKMRGKKAFDQDAWDRKSVRQTLPTSIRHGRAWRKDDRRQR